MLYMEESTTPFDPLGRTRGKPSQPQPQTTINIQNIYINIRFGFISRQIPQGSTPSADSDATKTV